MNIGKYKLEADSMNIILSCPSDTKYLYYFSSVANALKFLVDEGVRESQLTDLKTVVAKQAELYKLISTLPPITPDSLKQKKGREALSTSE